jgi:multidrug efflux pump subunit AcrA (membrane-fusion protein)
METLEVEADVSESSIAKIRVGQPAEIQLDAFPELRLLGEVSRIVPTVDRSKATLLVKVRFVERDARVLPDMSAKIAFLARALTPEERKPVPALRADAIVKRDGADVVFVVEADNTVRPVPVRTGEKVGDLVRVDGIAPGTKVVASPPERLAAGVRVEAVKK